MLQLQRISTHATVLGSSVWVRRCGGTAGWLVRLGMYSESVYPGDEKFRTCNLSFR